MGAGFGALLVLALSGFVHCGAMCGPFAVSVAARQGGAGRTLLPYVLGKACTYGILGLALATGIEAAGAGPGGSHAWRSTSALIAGVALVLFGLARAIRPRQGAVPASLLRRAQAIVRPLQILWQHLATLPGIVGSFGLGMAGGLLPCGLSWAALLLATQAPPLEAFAGMFIFGLGTSPALALLGLGSRRLPWISGKHTAQMTGVLLVLLGLWTMWRGGALPGGPEHCPACAEEVEG